MNGVKSDNLPAVGWDLVWGKLPHLLCQEGLAAVADIAPCHVAGNIVGDAQPPVIAGDQLQCLPPPWPVITESWWAWTMSWQSWGSFGTYTCPLYMTRCLSPTCLIEACLLQALGGL